MAADDGDACRHEQPSDRVDDRVEVGHPCRGGTPRPRAGHASPLRIRVAPVPAFTASTISISAREWASLLARDVNTSNLTAGNWPTALPNVACCAGVRSRSAFRSCCARHVRATPPTTTRVSSTPSDRSRMRRPSGKKQRDRANHAKHGRAPARSIKEKKGWKRGSLTHHVRQQYRRRRCPRPAGSRRRARSGWRGAGGSASSLPRSWPT